MRNPRDTSGTPLNRVAAAAGRLLRWSLPRATGESATPLNWVWVLMETAAVCGVALALSIWLAPNDPFGLTAQFPWIWIAPALLAMRYGSVIGVASVIMLLASWSLVSHAVLPGAIPAAEFPKEYFLGGLILVLIAGQFSDIWTARTRRLRAVNAYLDERLKALTKNHFLLRLSHERLEQDLLAKPLTLRETLLRLREMTNSTPATPENPLPGAREFMQLVGQSCQLESAAIYAVDAAGRPVTAPVARLGNAGELVVDDPLVRFSLEQNELAHVQSDEASTDTLDSSRYLVCSPLLTSSGDAPAFFTVEKMPFFALNDDTLQLLSVLIGYYADGLRLRSVAHEILDQIPDCPTALALDIVRLHRIRHEAGIDSSLVALVFDTDTASLDIFEQLRRLRRAVDLSWERSSPTHRALITLLPLAGAAAVEGYLLRIESALQAQFGAGFLSSHVTTHTARLGLEPPARTLTNLIERCGL